MRVKQGRVVLLDYMVRVGTGRVVETSAGKAPIEYLHGAGQILPALERALDGLKEGEQAAYQSQPTMSVRSRPSWSATRPSGHDASARTT